jgi:hypothetical protein
MLPATDQPALENQTEYNFPPLLRGLAACKFWLDILDTPNSTRAKYGCRQNSDCVCMETWREKKVKVRK